MIDLLMEAKKRKERERSGGRVIGPKTLDRLQQRYLEILAEGYEENPEPLRRPGTRGRLKRGKSLNLLMRFDERWEEIMAFLLEESVPFDSNEAERDLRMMKVKQKISGCFRSFAHGQAFVTLRSIIATAKKHSLPVLEILSQIVTNPKLAQQRILSCRMVTVYVHLAPTQCSQILTLLPTRYLFAVIHRHPFFATY